MRKINCSISTLHGTQFLGLVLLLLFVSSCSLTRFVPPNDKLYTGSKVKIEDKEYPVKNKKELQNELESVLRPRPNSSFLGIRYRLMLYNMIDTVTKKKGIKNYIKNRLGEPPVLMSKFSVSSNKNLITNRLDNQGYFKSTCSADTISSDRKVRYIFRPVPGPQYKIRKVEYQVDSSILGKDIVKNLPRTILREGNSYDLDIIKAERVRIDNNLKEHGYYYFSPDRLFIYADSTVGKYQVDLYLQVKDNTPLKEKQKYFIENIYVVPNYDIAQDSIYIKPGDKYKDFYVIDKEKRFKPQVFERTMFFHQGDYYNRTDHNLSLNRLINLGEFRFVKNRFYDIEGDSNGMEVMYFLTPLPKKSINAQITLKQNDADFTGSDFSVGWLNRNTFRGAEMLRINAYVGADIQRGGDSLNNRNYYKFGAEANLSIPKFILPFQIQSTSAFVPRTIFTLGYDYLKRSKSYVLNSFRGSAGYVWKENVRKEHDLRPITINYVHPSNVTSEYQEIALSDRTLLKAIEQQFTFGPSYRFTYSTTSQTERLNTFYYRGGLDMSGNIVGLITGANIRAGKESKIFNAAFSQFIKVENDFRYFRRLGRNYSWANRFIAGYGYAYGNSVNLPFVKQFFVGGTNSVRAFRARSIGPGSYYAPNDPRTTGGFTADQSGDIKLEANTELRAKLYKFIYGAVFVDAGQIWLLNQNIDPAAYKEGAVISKDFLKDIAAGTGIGVRLDVNFFVLRLDVATPLYKPWLSESNPWSIKDFNIGNKSWRQENIVWNLAIGYPF